MIKQMRLMETGKGTDCKRERGQSVCVCGCVLYRNPQRELFWVIVKNTVKNNYSLGPHQLENCHLNELVWVCLTVGGHIGYKNPYVNVYS